MSLTTGWGTDEGAIISILAHRNAKQRSLIRQTYAETHGEDLLKALDKELSSDFEVGIWNQTFPYFDSLQFRLFNVLGASNHFENNISVAVLA